MTFLCLKKLIYFFLIQEQKIPVEEGTNTLKRNFPSLASLSHRVKFYLLP
jgi:hypothetical protein